MRIFFFRGGELIGATYTNRLDISERKAVKNKIIIICVSNNFIDKKEKKLDRQARKSMLKMQIFPFYFLSI